MMVSGCALAISRNGPPMSPSLALARTDSDSIRTPDFSFGATMSIIACMIEGTPAMTMTLPILKPGARMVALWISSAPSGIRAPPALANPPHHLGMMIDADAEPLGDAVGGDVVMGRPDAAGGEDVGVAMAQRIQRRDDVGLVVGHDAHLLEIDPDIGQVFRDKSDVLVLGPPGQDLVADHQNSRGDDVAHDLSSPCITVPLPSQPLEVTGFCCRNKHRAAIFSGTARAVHTRCSPGMHIALARALLPSL